MKAIVVSAFMGTAIMTSVAAQDVDSANYLLSDCEAAIGSSRVGNGFNEGYCLGVVAGLASIGGSLTGGPRCLNIPKGITRGQMLRVVVRYIEAQPKRLHEPFASLAFEGLHDAWPCRN
jgi:hypothetical protein